MFCGCDTYKAKVCQTVGHVSLSKLVPDGLECATLPSMSVNHSTLSRVMSELGKRSAAKRLAAMTDEQKSAWGKAAQRNRTYTRKAKSPVAKPFGTANAG